MAVEGESGVRPEHLGGAGGGKLQGLLVRVTAGLLVRAVGDGVWHGKVGHGGNVGA